MPFIASLHGAAQLYYRDYVSATIPQPFLSIKESQATTPPIFISAWPFPSNMYDHLLPTLIESHRFRCILPDRRGYGKSQWAGSALSTAIDYEAYASDPVQIVKTALPSPDQHFYSIGSSLGCGEWLLALRNDPALLKRCKGLVFIGSSLPIPLRTELKPHGPLREFWDKLLNDLRPDPGEALAGAIPFIFRPGREGNELSGYDRARYIRMAEDSDVIGLERTVQAFLERDLTSVIEEVGKMAKLKVLILHGGKDEVNPTHEEPGLVKKYIPETDIRVYEGGAHGLVHTDREECMRDMLAFLDATDSGRDTKMS